VLLHGAETSRNHAWLIRVAQRGISLERRSTQKQPINFNRILDENNAPVARMRLFSRGVQFNNRIFNYESIAGDKGCLACGNCIDACPVVREKKRFVLVQNQRTSMSLENIVGDDCRRCFACARSCPQVSKTVKEDLRAFRRGERIVHNYAATLFFLLAGTGIFLYHYKELIPNWHHVIFKWSHISFGILLILSPVLYYFIDPHHMKRAFKSAFRFGAEDVHWLKEFAGYLRKPWGNPLPNWREFNTYHKFWFVYLCTVIPLLAVTGIINILGADIVGPVVAGIGSYIHVTFALISDLLILTHLYFKLIRVIYRDISDTAKSVRNYGSLNYSTLYNPKSDQ
jgi:cytochrome b subunit of formate dehydrogenase